MLEFDNPASPLYQHPSLREARRSFYTFYACATIEDATWMDALVMGFVAVTLGINQPREEMAPADRDALERVCDAAERKYLEIRDQVRVCPTFRRLRPAERKQIEFVLFDPYLPRE